MASFSLSKRWVLVIVGAVLLLFAGLAGAYAIMASDMDKDQASQAATPAQTNDTLLAFTNAFYAEYYAEPTNGKTVMDTAKAALEKYGTTNAVSNFSAQQKMCFQNMPASVTADDVASLENPFKVNVTYNFTEDPGTAVVTVVNQTGSLKIDSINCD